MHRSRMACLPSLLLCLFGGVLAVGVFVLWAVTGDPSARARSATATPIMSTAMPTTVPTAQVRIETRVSGPAVAQGMRAQARLETVEVPMTVPVTGTISAGRFERLVGVQNRDSIVFLAHGVATAGVDLATVADDDVAVLSDGTIVLTVTTELFHVWLDNQASTIVDRDRNVFARLSAESDQLETAVRQKAEGALRDAACMPDMGVVQQAATQVAPALEQILSLVAARTAARSVPVRVVAVPGTCRVPPR